jgi:hypothetical protein
MKMRRLSPAIALLLLTAVSTTRAGSLSTETTLTRRDATVADAVRPEVFASPKAAPKGTLDAPVDGKDGKPHAGPWVETSAERDRKKEKADGKVPVKSDATESSAEHHHIGPDGKPMPHSNGGVMDDPHRLGPKEGTRGTEGGVSEKSKESKLAAEKVPERPKEIPPLPHSEQEKMPEDLKGLTDTKLDDGEKVLEVGLSIVAFKLGLTW